MHNILLPKPQPRKLNSIYPWADNVDWVTPTMPPIQGLTNVTLCEDNDAVLKNLLKCRTPTLLHVARTHRVNLHMAHEAMKDPAFRARCIHSTKQTADMLTKGSHSAALWHSLLTRAQLQPRSKFTPTNAPTANPTTYVKPFQPYQTLHLTTLD